MLSHSIPPSPPSLPEHAEHAKHVVSSDRHVVLQQACFARLGAGGGGGWAGRWECYERAHFVVPTEVIGFYTTVPLQCLDREGGRGECYARAHFVVPSEVLAFYKKPCLCVL